MGIILNTIQEKLSLLDPLKIEIIDETHKHASHINPGTKETHFKITVISSHFENKTKIERHKMIYKLLDYELKNHLIHALQLITLTENENEN